MNAVTREAADLSAMLDTATCGLIKVDKNGLIQRVNRRAAELLGEAADYLARKPLSLFIMPEDQALFFINRSRIIGGASDATEPFEIRFKPRSGTPWTGRIRAHPVTDPGQRLPGLMMAVDDISGYRQVLETLQIKTDTIKLLYSIIDDLSVWSPPDIDAAIVYTLEKIGLMAGAERIYVGLLHHRRARFSITHEWLADGVASPALTWVSTPWLSGILQQLKKRAAVRIADIDALDPTRREAHGGFHAPGTRAAMFAPLSYGRTILGIIGCDIIGRVEPWSPENGQLILHIGDAIVGALIRRQAENLPQTDRTHLFRFVPPRSASFPDVEEEYDGPIEFIDDTQKREPQEAQWQFAADAPDDEGEVTTASLKDGKSASLACHACYRQRVLDIADIRSLGTRFKATCPCGQSMRVRIELRREYRKTVHLEGIFIRDSLNRLTPQSDQWGPLTVRNLSRRGIGFTIQDHSPMNIGDCFRVKFSLDNTAGSIIQKEVAVRSITGDIVGCEFVDHDPCDVTIGFYMMT
jgi:PAS domain S-box-containing protein